MKYILVFCAQLLMISLIATDAADSEKPLSVDELVTLASSGKTDDFIISQLQKRGVDFEANVAVVQRLVDAGMSPGALQVMLSVSGRNKQPGGTVIIPSGPSVPGLTVSTEPSGMDVYLNGQIQGLTPYFSNKLEPAKYIVRVQHPLFITQEKTIEFKGDTSVFVNWEMEPVEPIVRFDIELESDGEDYPWSWVIRPKQNCPDPVDLLFEPAPQHSSSGNAIFTLNPDSKATYQGTGSTCFELFLWRGKIRTDLSVKDLPPPVARYLISAVQIRGIRYIDLTIKITVNRIDPLHPDVTMDSTTGYLLNTEDKAPTVAPEELQKRLLETMNKTGD